MTTPKPIEPDLDFEIIEPESSEAIPEPPEDVIDAICVADHGRPSGLLGLALRVADGINPLRMGTSAGGWGTPSSSYGKTNIVKITGRGITLWMHREVATIFGALLVDLDNHLKTKGRSMARKADDWGYAHRYIRGTTKWSNHAWGKAADFNAIDNPQSARLITEFDPGFIDRLLKTKYRGLIRWGGRYGGATKKDAMHFEWIGTVAQARALTAALRKAPVPVPVKPNPTPPGHGHARPVLSPGLMNNQYVRDVQGHLNYAFRAYPKIAPLKTDGDFGERTLIRLREWQKRTGIPVVGRVDDRTWNRLHEVTKGARLTEAGKAF